MSNVMYVRLDNEERSLIFLYLMLLYFVIYGLNIMESTWETSIHVRVVTTNGR